MNPIAISLSPNLQIDDQLSALKILISPWRWKSGPAIKKAENWFENYLKEYNIFSFCSGRTALYYLLKAFEISKGDEVIIQAFTCVAVADPIIWTGAKPVFCDIDDTFNINPKLLEKRINDKTRAIIVQHTFGIPANVYMIKKIAHKHNLILIEDCAHSLGVRINNKNIGTIGDAAIFSFGRDKIISSVFGGVAAIHYKFNNQSVLLGKLQKNLNYPSFYWIFQQLFHPVMMTLILPFYDIGIGKLLLSAFQKLNLLSKPIEDIEKYGGKPDVYLTKYPNALAYLLMNQLRKLQNFNKKRRRIAQVYFSKFQHLKRIQLPPYRTNAVYLRFNILTKNSYDLWIKAKKEKMLLGNWYHNIVDPIGVNFSKINYQIKSCPQAEKYALLSLNLPTYPRLKFSQINKIVNFIIKYINS